MKKQYLLNPLHFDKWFHQNNACIEEFSEGCLLDNYLLSVKRGYALVQEHYVNSNMSDYLITFYENVNQAFDDWLNRFPDCDYE